MRWQPCRWEVLSEAYIQDGESLASAQWGTYAQGAFEVAAPFFLVGRYEHFDPSDPDQTLDLFTIGGGVRPWPFMAIKVEYGFVVDAPAEDNPAGFSSSFTTFF